MADRRDSILCQRCFTPMEVLGEVALVGRDSGLMKVTIFCPSSCGQPDRSTTVPAASFTDVLALSRGEA